LDAIKSARLPIVNNDNEELTPKLWIISPVGVMADQENEGVVGVYGSGPGNAADAVHCGKCFALVAGAGDMVPAARTDDSQGASNELIKW
jgi:hypothetical protein